ncbi:YiiX/YebB-like N1pC/P60 family cysteine hydrolase [Paenibacillus terrae]
MNKLFKTIISLSVVISVLVLPTIQVSAEEVNSSISTDVYQEMKSAGMSDQDIKMVKKHNMEEIEYINSGKLKEKALEDQQAIALQGDKSDERNAAISPNATKLGSYGDILVAFNASSWGIDFGYPGHAGIVSNTNGYTIESFPADGVQYHTNDWGSRTNIYAMHVKGASSSNYTGAASYAYTKIGKPYNWNFVNPWSEDKFYCSQLVWKAWKTQGIDVDYITIDPIVTPMEIAKSGNTSIYYSN